MSGNASFRSFHVKAGIVVLLAMLLAACGPSEETAGQSTSAGPKSLIYSWMSDPNKEVPNFLAVIDADSASPTYGTILKTVAAGEVRGNAHHSNFTLPYSGMLFTNDFFGDGTYIFDTADPINPVLASSFRHIGDYTFAHTFAELPNGNMLATFQTKGMDNKIPGGLVELTTTGEPVQTGSADPGDAGIFMRPYSLVLLPHLDRVVTTNADMKEGGVGRHIQIWRLSDLALLHTIPMGAPEGARPGIAGDPFEIRLLEDHDTVIINTVFCGLYTLTDVGSDTPRLRLVHDFDAELCFIPVRIGQYWVQSVVRAVAMTGGVDIMTGDGALEVLDLSDPTSPVVVDHLEMAEGMVPHWLSPDQAGERIVVLGFGPQLINRVMLVNFDSETGKLEIDEAFGGGNEAGPGLITAIIDRPGGERGPAVPHGSVFWPSADPSWKN